MKTLQLVLVRQYRKSPTEEQRANKEPGTLVYVYKVTGDQVHIDAYIASKAKEEGVNMKAIKQDDGQVNFFSTRKLLKLNQTVPNLMETSKGKWVPDNTEADDLKNLSDQYGIEIAMRMLSQKAVTE